MSTITESYIEIMNLVYSYPERIDAGDFAGVGELFAEGVFETEGGEPLRGREAVQANFERWTRRHPDDGTPTRATASRIRSSRSTRTRGRPSFGTT